MLNLKLAILPLSIILIGCGGSDLTQLQADEIARVQAAQAIADNPFQVASVEADDSVIVDQPDTMTVNDAQETAFKPEPVIITEVDEPVTVFQVDEPVTINEVLEMVNTIDPDGETVFTYQDTSNNKWTNPQKSWVDSYSVGNRCFMYTSLDHNIGNVMVDTPYGKRSIAMVQQLIGDGPGIGDNPRYNDIQCGNGPANDYGDEDAGQCPGRIDQGASGCGTIGPKWYFDQ